MENDLSALVENLSGLGKATSLATSEYYKNLTDLGIPLEYAIILTRDFHAAILGIMSRS
jgi:hypothetical protein